MVLHLHQTRDGIFVDVSFRFRRLDHLIVHQSRSRPVGECPLNRGYIQNLGFMFQDQILEILEVGVPVYFQIFIGPR